MPVLIGALTRATVDVFRNHRDPAQPRKRAGFAAVALVAAVATVLVAARGDGRAVVAAVCLLIAPDLPLLFAYCPGLRQGQFHPRCVPAYNATHRLAGPILALAVAGAAGSLTAAAGALAWLTHVCFDRACGYGLRAPDGWQRGSTPRSRRAAAI